MKPKREFSGSDMAYVFYVTQVALTIQALDYVERFN